MSAPCCHETRAAAEGRKQKTVLGRVKEFAGWILPGAVLALMPKCPLCLAAYLALFTGVTMSYSSAHFLMRTLTLLCVGALALCAIRRVVSFRHN